MKFKVLISERALKDLKKLDKIYREKIYNILKELESPFELDIKKLQDHIYRDLY